MESVAAAALPPAEKRDGVNQDVPGFRSFERVGWGWRPPASLDFGRTVVLGEHAPLRLTFRILRDA